MDKTDFLALLEKYAEVCIRIAVNLQEGQLLWLICHVDLADFGRLAAKQAYLAGAKYVHIQWLDAPTDYVRLKYGGEDALLEYPDWDVEARLRYLKAGGALLSIYAENPELMADIEPNRLQVANKTRSKYFVPLIEFMNSDDAPNAAIVSAAMPGWAKKVFPEMHTAEATAKLWDTIFDICRVKTDDPVDAWADHQEYLIARCGYLNIKQYRELHYRGSGTDLRVGLPDEHVWLGGGQEKMGIFHMPNIPTEEVFTTPHRERVNGTVSNTKPFAMRGMFVPKFTLTFENGRVVKAVAEEGQAYLDNLLDTDEGARYLGEVALVPHSSPISQSGILFYNGLYDENAACHLALGRAYREGITHSIGISSDDFMAKGGNESAIHVDFMIGDETLDIDGLRADGTREAIMRGGEWAFELE